MLETMKSMRSHMYMSSSPSSMRRLLNIWLPIKQAADTDDKRTLTFVLLAQHAHKNKLAFQRSYFPIASSTSQRAARGYFLSQVSKSIRCRLCANGAAYRHQDKEPGN